MTFKLFSLCFELKTVRVPFGYKPPGSRAPVWGLLACRHFKFTCWAQAVPRSAHIATPKQERVNRDRDWLEVNDLGALCQPHAAVWTSMQTPTFLNPWFFKGEFSPRKLHPQFFLVFVVSVFYWFDPKSPKVFYRLGCLHTGLRAPRLLPNGHREAAAGSCGARRSPTRGPGPGAAPRVCH